MEKETWKKVCPFCKNKNYVVDKDDKLVSSGMRRGYVCSKCFKTFDTPLEIMETQKEE